MLRRHANVSGHHFLEHQHQRLGSAIALEAGVVGDQRPWARPVIKQGLKYLKIIG